MKTKETWLSFWRLLRAIKIYKELYLYETPSLHSYAQLTPYEAKGDGGNYQNQQHSTILGLTREGKKEERTHDQKIWLTWATDTRSMLNIQSCHRLWPLGQWWTGGYTVAVRDSVYTISNRLTLTVWSSYWWWERDKW